MTQTSFDAVPLERRLYCNRTLNLRAIRAIGYDMDYTLVDYDAEAFERRVYAYAIEALVAEGWSVGDLTFDPEMVTRGLVIDTEQGNILKANRFGFVKRAMHGTTMLDFATQREAYARTIVDLSESRWVFLNTLFSLSEGCLYAQLVDRLDQGRLPGIMGYRDLYAKVRAVVDAQHVEGRLKAEIAADPARYVLRDPEAVLALQDQKAAGKKLMLITNSEWAYTAAMMAYAFDPFLPSGRTWRDLFDVVIVGARKPEFFTERNPFFEVVTEDGLLKPVHGPLKPGVAYWGGSAVQLERQLGLSGEEILYVGDHLWGDVRVTKSVLRWRTALVLRELEREIEALVSFRPTEQILARQMAEKERLEAEYSQARLELQRLKGGYGPTPDRGADALEAQMGHLRARLVALDQALAPMAKASSELSNARWGLLTRAGNDKSQLARQVERDADVYTSRVSNFAWATPFVYLRSLRGTLPHDPATPGGAPLE